MVDYTNVITIESAQGIVARTPNDPKVKRTIDGTLLVLLLVTLMLHLLKQMVLMLKCHMAWILR